jgi:Protein of unknown function (DUF3455)
MRNVRWMPQALSLALLFAADCSRMNREPSEGDPASKLPALSMPSVPDALRTSDGEVLVARAAAQGSQIYECQAGDGGPYAWKLVGPKAELTDQAGKLIGRHYAGPTWESTDGSKVVGEVKARADAPGGQSVPWLLLKATTTSGSGVFSKVTSVQRVDTVGGVAPSTGCEAQHAGARESVPYRATYYFYSMR